MYILWDLALKLINSLWNGCIGTETNSINMEICQQINCEPWLTIKNQF